MHNPIHFLTVFCATLLVAVSPTWACPDIDGMLDVNCDGQLKIVAFGDSITAGERDSQRLGYPGRLRLLLPHAVVYNYGDSGESTSSGRSRAPRAFRKVSNIDYIILLEGVNDWWGKDHSSSKTKNNLTSMQRSGKNTGAIVLLAQLTQVARSNQKAWVSAVNRAIKPYANINFYTLGTSILSSDKLHPNGNGYQKMALSARQALSASTTRNRPIDRDGDGVYDYEERRLSTNPFLADSDSDGLSDGQELYAYRTNPLTTDSDGDGVTDGEEAAQNLDPNDPTPGAPLLQSLEPLPL